MSLQTDVVSEIMAAAALSLVCCVLLFYRKSLRLCRMSDKGRGLDARLLPVFLLVIAVGFFRGTQARREALFSQALFSEGQWIRYEGTVEKLGRKEKQWELELRLWGQQEDNNQYPGKLLVYVDHEIMEKALGGPSYRPVIGCRMAVEGQVQPFDESRNPGEFDFRGYYRARGLFFRMRAERCRICDSAGDRLRDGLFSLSCYAGEMLDQVAGPEYAGIFRAVILGERRGLDADIRDLYQRNGIAHLLTISGLHLSMISMAVYGLLRKSGMGYGMAGIAGGLLLAAYGIMTGASPSVVRALLMALCGYLAAYLGRTYDLLSALALAGICLAWQSPYMLLQSGVQLSFAAIFGIGAAAPWLARQMGLEQQMDAERQMGTEPEAGAKGFHVRRILAASVGMQLVTLPIVLYHFFQFPVYGIFLNLLVVPLMGIVVASGIAGILAGSFCRVAGRFAIGSGCGILRLYEWLCRIFETLPASNLILGRPHFWQIGIYYGILAACVMMDGKRPPWRRWQTGIVRLLVFFLILLPFPSRGLQVTFLDVGQGDGICIQADGYVILVDGGSSDERELGEQTLEPFLKSQGITKVDYAVVSHGDQDHVSGLLYLMQSARDISVSHVILPKAGQSDPVYGQLEQLVNGQGGSCCWMDEGDRLELGRLCMECLYPSTSGKEQERLTESPAASSDRNEHSLVLRVTYGEFRMLLTGDMSSEGERRILERMEPGRMHVLKVAHHGSRTASSPAWLDAICPVWAVVSCGRDNRYGHPHPEVIQSLQERDIAVWETTACGAVTFWTDGKGIRWKRYLP